ncbi:MAG: ATP-dependent RNA helicase HrpA [Halioglobus sp.]|nr:ATP-dependent RNA helicase HrpA [Halioglobus sp.]
MQECKEEGRLLPDIVYPEDLPVAARRQDIAAAIAANQVVIVAGETGSGKTTQLPKICLELGRGQRGLIGHTQPRRLAARNVAARIATELGGDTGGLVGYQVRFNERVSDATVVKLMTDGILLGELQRDRRLERYDTLIIDEAHERSLNIDFLLGYLKRLLPRRSDLKLIVTSATIDVEGFSRFFDDAPVIEVSGRTYPVETIYRDAGAAGGEGDGADIVGLVRDIEAGRFGERGDVLVFVPGEREIRELARALRGVERVEVLPLYSRLGQAEQNRVFDSARRRSGIRAVLATNVAETSLTVPGIRYVIDPGEARISRYSHRSQLQRLPVEAISQASANQRRGRCGRVGPGVCLRLYSEEDFAARPAFTEPEIQRTNLAAVVLQMLSLGLGDVSRFPFIDPPDARLVRDGFRLLEELGAATARGKLTSLGRRMARFPVDPRLARMILQADREHCLDEILVIASALSVQDPRERPADKQAQADQQHARFRHPRSDFMAWLGLWSYYEEQRQSLSQNQLRKLCKREFLSYMRMREWRDTHMQLRIACRQQKLRLRGELPAEENYRAVHRALLSGLLANIGQQHEGREYLGARNRRFLIFPGSALARKSPPWVMAAEIVETSRVYARQVAAIEPDWALDINPALLRRHYCAPSWRARTGQVMASERTSLFGLTLADNKRVHYGPIAPAESRQIMINEALVAGDYRQYPEFLRHNRRLVREVLELEARTRRRDILVQDRVLAAFYDERLPADVFTARRLESWLRKHPEREPGLYMARDMLLAYAPGDDVEQQFPAQLQWQDLGFRLSYEFQPGQDGDGVSVTVPVALLNRAPRYLFDWLVPGLLREKCIALLKGLPKDKRRQLVPVPDTVDRVLQRLQSEDRDLLQALAQALQDIAGVTLCAADWNPAALDDYYRMNIRVVDARGRLLGQGRDLARLIEQFRDDTRQSVSAGQQDSPAREGITRWDFGDLPQRWQFRQAGLEIVAWPALVDRGDSVAIELCDYPGQASLQHRLGLVRLFRLRLAQQVKALRKQLLHDNHSHLLLARTDCEREPLVEDMIDAAVAQAMALEGELPRSEDAFSARLERGRDALLPLAQDLERQLCSALSELAAARSALAQRDPRIWPDSRADVEAQTAALLAPHFQRDTPAEWLQQYPRYMKALRVRAERLAGQYGKDQDHMAMLAALGEPLAALLADRPESLQLSEEVATYRWMLEEFRVSLFAQSLGTRRPVSRKRLLEQWRHVEDWLARNPR